MHKTPVAASVFPNASHRRFFICIKLRKEKIS